MSPTAESRRQKGKKPPLKLKTEQEKLPNLNNRNKKLKKKKNEKSLTKLWDNKRSNIRIPEEKEKRAEKVFEEIMVENFPNLARN